jgi:hypothetical protein
MVYENKYYLVLKQGRHIQAKARPFPSWKLFPGLLGWQRCEQGRKVPSMEV